MNKDQLKAYLASKGTRCPFCKSDALLVGETDTGDDAIYRNVVCGGCRKEWTDEYTLTGVTESE